MTCFKLVLPVLALMGDVFLYAAFPMAVRGMDIPTAQYNNSRTAWNSSEIWLNTSNVSPATFGKLFSRIVDGRVYADPLYLQAVPIAGYGTPNVIYVCTANDSVYAFDADNPALPNPYWQASLGAPDSTISSPSSPDPEPILGIISTPVIDRPSGTLYVTAATHEFGHRVYRLHALDIATGIERPNSPVVISGQVAGNAWDAQSGVVAFNPDLHLQRAGLAISGGSVYLMMAGCIDTNPFHGWIFGYGLSSLANTAVLSVTPNGMGGGIWQSMRAPVVDAGGNLYLETGNGDYDGEANFGDSVVRLAPGANGLAVADWFTPDYWQYLSAVDLDLASAGPLLVPGSNSLIAGSKNGTIFVLNANNLGQLVSGNGQIPQILQATAPCTPVGCNTAADLIFWSNASGSTLYLWPANDVLMAYQWSSGKLSSAPVNAGVLSSIYPGGLLAGSSNAGTPGTGIVWALTSGTGNTPAPTLHAFDASNLSRRIWGSDMNAARDAAGSFSKDVRPLVVNGKVYVGNFSGRVDVYGLLNGSGTAPAAVALKSTPNPTAYSQPLTLTSAVSALAATGTVSFMDETTLLGSAPVISGAAVLAGVSLPAGSHSLEAIYSGDSVYAGASSALTQLVNPLTPVVTWSAPAAITFGGALGSAQLTATASVPGTFSYSPPAGTVLPVGPGHALSALFTPADATDYRTVTAATSIDVNPTAGANLVVTKVLTRSGGNIVVQLTIANTGGSTAANLQLTGAKIGSGAAMSLPQSLGSVAGGSSIQATITVPGTVGASGAASSFSVSGTYTGGSFSSSARVTLP